MLPELTVTEITSVIQRLFCDAFYRVKVRGEISGLSRPSSGHVYLSLKDKDSIINAVCWSGTKLKAQFCDGLEVVCTGHLRVYQSRYQLVIEEMVFAGLGKLAAMLEERKKKLASEGIFDANNKKKLPLLPLKIGVATSLSGSVIQDIIDRVKSRFPSHVVVWPVQVQGEQASAMIIDAILGFNNMCSPPDVIIVARGGGSIEDLWPFNDEELARVVAASNIPVVSAVGHETDFTIIDYASDVRAPTPTAAVEIVLPNKQDLLRDLSNLFFRMRSLLYSALQAKRHRLLVLSGVLVAAKNKTMQICGKALEYQPKILSLLQVLLLKKKRHLDNLIYRISYYDKQHVLAVGYTIVYSKEGKHVRSPAMLSKDDTITIEWKDGKLKAAILP